MGLHLAVLIVLASDMRLRVHERRGQAYKEKVRAALRAVASWAACAVKGTRPATVQLDSI